MSTEYEQALALFGEPETPSEDTSEYAQAAALFGDVPATQAPTAAPKESGALDWAYGVGENLVSMATGAGAEIASGLGGLATLATGGSLEDAVNNINNIQEYGVDVTSEEGKAIQEGVATALSPVVEGAKWLEENTSGALADAGYPLAATIIRAAPEAVISAVGAGAITKRSLKTAAKTKANQKARLESPDPDVKYDGDLAEVKLDKSGNVVDDAAGKRLSKALDMPKETVAVITNTDPVTKGRIKALMSTMKKGSNNAISRLTSNVNTNFGASVSARMATLGAKRNEVGNLIKAEVPRLAKTKLDVKDSSQAFIANMQQAFGFKTFYNHRGPFIRDELIPEGSFLKTTAGSKAKKTLTDVVTLLRENSQGAQMNGAVAHKLKNMLDEIVDASKASEGGLSSTVERGIFELRSSINDQLRKANPKYAELNDQYVDILGIQKPFNDLLPEGAKWGDKASSEALGKALKNATDYSTEGAAIRALDTRLRDYGINFTDDPVALVQVYKGMQDYLGSPDRLQEYLKANKAALDSKVFDSLASAGVGNMFGVVHDVAKLRSLKFTERQIQLVQKRMREVYDEVSRAIDK